MIKDTAPKSLLKVVSCPYKKRYSEACSCRKSGLHCSSASKHCCSLSCDNVPEVQVEDDDETFSGLEQDEAESRDEENSKQLMVDIIDEPGPSKRKKYD
ncbi:hypothetical protein ILUMI_21020 [Ignelater luminosus]|uniref:Uncharacterized protein n=1 Tax=Ignelater luminosus TaxID=2038154 RepID=A0A8K0CD85_IGNLU|nr:hypothetical protein ILUMI_21020 [Ignelater luminosus]